MIVIADIDIQLLLAIQWACNKTGTKIPWKECAEIMGSKFTEGAIVQHLSKLRVKREELDKPCPPPLKRAAGSSSKNDMSQKKSLLPSATEDTPPRSKRKREAANRRQDDSEDDIYTVKRKAQQRARKNGNAKDLFNPGSMKSDPGSPTQKLVHANAPWLKDLSRRDELDDDETYNEGSSTGSSQSTAQSAKQSKMVTFKMEPERLASVEADEARIDGSRYVDPAAFPAPVTPTQVPRTIVNQAPQRRTSFLPYMPVTDVSSFPTMSQNPHNPYGSIYPVQFPSSAPSPFNVANRVMPAQTPTQTTEASGYDFMTAYPQVEIPYELSDEFMSQNGYAEQVLYGQNFDDDLFVTNNFEDPEYKFEDDSKDF